MQTTRKSGMSVPVILAIAFSVIATLAICAAIGLMIVVRVAQGTPGHLDSNGNVASTQWGVTASRPNPVSANVTTGSNEGTVGASASSSGVPSTLAGTWMVGGGLGEGRMVINRDGTIGGEGRTWERVSDGTFRIYEPTVFKGKRVYRFWLLTPTDDPTIFGMKSLDEQGTLCFQTTMQRLR